MSIRRFLAIALFCLLPSGLWATAQAPEILRSDGKEYALQTTPLTPYLESHPGKLPRSEVMSSGNWRGYFGTWAIRDGKLFLEDVRIATRKLMDPKASESEQFRSVMKELFGKEGPEQATWFTGRLVVPTGKIVEYVHMGFASTYSSYLVATIVAGEVRDRKSMSSDEFTAFRRRQFELFKKTPEYAAALKEAREGDAQLSERDAEDFIFQFDSGAFESRIFEPLEKPHK